MRPPPGTRVVLDEMAPDQWRIVIAGRPTNTLMLITLACLCWLAGWAVGEVFALRALFAQDRDPTVEIPLVVWACAWTIGGIAGLWFLRKVVGIAFGIETILLRPKVSKVIATLWGISSSDEYETRKLESFEANARLGLRMQFQDCRVKFGYALTDQERKWLLAELRRILKGWREKVPGGM